MSSGMIYHSPAGVFLIREDEYGICAIGRAEPDEAPDACSRSPLLKEAARQLDAYFAGRLMHVDLPLSVQGTSFERAVWAKLRAIPYGEVRTYGEIARQIGAPGAARAVGRACGANPVLIVTPCHRVIGADGKLTGFAAGLEVKQRLLALEGHVLLGGRVIK